MAYVYFLLMCNPMFGLVEAPVNFRLGKAKALLLTVDQKAPNSSSTQPLPVVHCILYAHFILLQNGLALD